jgi:hypothetical protein
MFPLLILLAFKHFYVIALPLFLSPITIVVVVVAACT